MQEWCASVQIDPNTGPPVAGLGVWGDSGKLWTKDGLVMLLFNVLTSTCNARFPIVALSKKHLCQCGCYGRHTYERIFEVIGWALKTHARGKFPTHRDDGAPFQWSNKVGDRNRFNLQNTYMRTRGACIQKRGDWAWYKQIMGIVAWKGEGIEKRICFRCRADGCNHPWTDVSWHATWMYTVFTHAEFIADAAMNHRYICGIFSWLGFDYKYISVDLMHCGDLGILLYVLGNSLYELFREMGS